MPVPQISGCARGDATKTFDCPTKGDVRINITLAATVDPTATSVRVGSELCSAGAFHFQETLSRIKLLHVDLM